VLGFDVPLLALFRAALAVAVGNVVWNTPVLGSVGYIYEQEV